MRSLGTAIRQIGSRAAEYILVDNGTGQETAVLWAGSRQLKTQPVRFLSCDRAGVSLARNYGASIARGEWLAFLDDDCEPEPGWWSAARREIGRKKTIAFGGPALARPESSAPVPWFGWDCEDLSLSPGPGGVLRRDQSLFEGNFWIRRRAFRKAGGFPENAGPRGGRWSTHEIRPLFQSLRRSHPRQEIRYLPEMKVRHRIDPATRSFPRKVLRTFRSGRDSTRFAGQRGSFPRFGLALIRLAATVPALRREISPDRSRAANREFLRRVYQAGETCPAFFQPRLPGSVRAARAALPEVVGLAYLPNVVCHPQVHSNLLHNVLENRRTFCQKLSGLVVRGPRVEVWDSQGKRLAEVSVAFPGAKISDRPAPSKTLPGRSVIMASTGDDSYFHWMMDVLPRFEIATHPGSRRTEPDRYIFNPLRHAFHREGLLKLGIPENKLHFLEPDRPIRLEQGILPSLPNPPGIPSRSAVAFLRRLWPTPPGMRGNRRLYLRRAVPAGRRVENEEQILAWLTPRGFEAVECGGLSVEEQARLLAGASVVVAPHGGALTNLVFAGKGTRVVELFGGDYVNPCYRNLAGILGLEYGAVLAEPVRPHRHLLNPPRSYPIHLPHLQKVLRELNIS